MSFVKVNTYGKEFLNDASALFEKSRANTLKSIVKFENKYKIEIPEDYKKYLQEFETYVIFFDKYMHYNLAYNEYLEFPRSTVFKKRIIVSDLYTIQYPDLYSAYELINKISKHNKYLIFSDNGSGDYNLICVKGENYGKIFSLSHEDIVEIKTAEKNIQLLADSFKLFYQGLKKN